ncbi:hypothetical protein N7475_005372 [Penicillium sp. IBT 31633x]|nr:hypothetical protein N7475_005372 [Penicillium sp. IBT 31633x]
MWTASARQNANDELKPTSQSSTPTWLGQMFLELQIEDVVWAVQERCHEKIVIGQQASSFRASISPARPPPLPPHFGPDHHA